MKTITFISDQNNSTFPLNTTNNFAVLVNQQDTNQRHHHDTRFFSLNKLITDFDPTPEARLFSLSCSLVRETSLFNTRASNVYKILCLAPQDYTGIGYTVNFKTVDPLPLVHNEDQIKFELASLTPTTLAQTQFHTTFPTVVNLVACPIISSHLNTMWQWHSQQKKIILDSSDENSLHYRQNNGTDFEIVLDSPFKTVNETWTMELNAIFIHHRVFSAFPLTLKPEQLLFGLGFITQEEGPDGQPNMSWKAIPLTSRTFNKPSDLLQTINFKFKKYSRVYGRAQFTITRGNKVTWDYKHSNMGEDKWAEFDMARVNDKNILDVILLLPKNGLGQLLGFVSPDEAKTVKATSYIFFSLWSRAHHLNIPDSPFHLDSSRYVYQKTVAPYPSFLPLLPTILQTPIVVTCNLVENSLVGLNHLRVLRLITTQENFKDPYICYSEFEQPLSVTLETKTFSRIHIQLCHLDGKPITVSSAGLNTPSINTVVVLTLRKQSI